MPDNPVLADLRAESAELDALVAGLDAEQWAVPTPAEGWTIAHQIAHLAWTDAKAHRAVTDPGGFREELRTAEVPLGEAVDEGAAEGARLAPQELLERWRAGRADLERALVAAPEDLRVPWFGPPMKVPSMATARIMETWAHGQDVVDALGLHREPTARLRHVAHLGVRTLGFAFALRGLPVPAEPVRVELTAPDGELWTWGPPEAPDRVTGPALDFCLLVTQRRHRDDLSVTATGRTAERWLPIAQAFAGDPGPGRQPSRTS
ncbi:TIGR03084 family metal-binding protein [Saccharopolyspora hirsuta]|uniref:TIGR03084 family protein n=1 Tax=Saccharopolyspora hirsuta TaxID=1837 RepID=A0A5M7B8W5_SACHI|nr:TIGR03084 family metal-binding protein [Saccharopolyspora hirsuta]KAA5826016.1 TIGR03084 family protein [Saccharopolyspora hirsuta]